MTDYTLSERPTKRAFLGSNSMDEDFFHQYTDLSVDSPFPIVPLHSAPIFSPGANNDNDKDAVAAEPNGAGTTVITTSQKALDDATSNSQKGTEATATVPDDNSKAEPANKEIAVDVGKIGKPNSSKSPSTTTQTSSSPSQPPPTNNRKRTRATPEQLAILEETFKTNTSPNSKVREALAEKVNMSERSIQIWFQNRRAKMKAMQKRVHMMREENMKVQFLCMPQFGHNLYPFRVAPMHPRIALPPRSYSNSDINMSNVGLNPALRPQPATGLGITIPQMSQGFWPSGPMTAPLSNMSTDPNVMNGFPFSASNVQARFPITPTASPNVNDVNASQPLRLVVNPNNPAGGIPMKMNDTPVSVQPQQQFTPQEFTSQTFTSIPCEILMIGSWRRILSTPQDLLCYYTLPQRVFTYEITNDGARFKMDFPLSEISAIEYRSQENNTCQVAIEVKDPPSFYMERHGAWSMCKDFTEGSQATRHLRHILKGRSDIMKKHILKLVQDDPQIAKIVTIVEESAYTNMSRQQQQQPQQQQPQQEQQQSNSLRRSSFPTNSENRFEDTSSFSDEEVKNVNANANKQQLNRMRRCASVPVSPEQPAAGTLATATPAMAQNLQINTSTEYAYKQIMNSGSDICSPLDGNSPPTPLDVYDASSEMIDTSPLLSEDPFDSMGQFENNIIADDLSTAAYMGNPDDFASLHSLLASVQNGSSELLGFGDGLGGGNDCLIDSWVNYS